MARADNIERFRGDTKDLVLKLTQNKAIFPLTGISAKFSVSAEENPTVDPIFQSVASVDDSAGSLTFPFTADNVNRTGEFFYDVQLTDGAGKTNTIRKGKLTFVQDITK